MGQLSSSDLDNPLTGPRPGVTRKPRKRVLCKRKPDAKSFRERQTERVCARERQETQAVASVENSWFGDLLQLAMQLTRLVSLRAAQVVRMKLFLPGAGRRSCPASTSAAA